MCEGRVLMRCLCLTCRLCSAGEKEYFVSPLLGNVLFASSESNWSFTLQSFAQIYADHYGMTEPHLYVWGSRTVFTVLLLRAQRLTLIPRS